MPAVFATLEDVGLTALKIFLDTLETLVISVLPPWHAQRYTDATNTPPITQASEWAGVVADLRKRMEASSKPEQYAQIAKDAATLLGAIQNAISGSNAPLDPADTMYRLLLPVLLKTCADPISAPRTGAKVLFFAIAALTFIDQRLQDSYSQGVFETRWLAVGRDLLRAIGWISGGEAGESQPTETEWPVVLTDGLIVILAIIDILREFKGRPEPFPERSRRWGYMWYGFDHPQIAGFENARTLAQKAFTALFAAPPQPFTVGAFSKILPQRDEAPPALLAITLVPVPKALDPEGKGQIYIQGEGNWASESEVGDGFKLTLSGSPSFGLLASTSSVQPIGDVGFQVELSKEWPDALGSPTSTTPPQSTSLSFQATKFSLGARAEMEDVAAWLELDKGELAINGGHWLTDYIPKLRISFDIAAEASMLNGIRFKGGAGGDILLPINERVSYGPFAFTISTIRIRANAQLGDDGKAFALAATASLNLKIGGLQLFVDGIGATYSTGTAPKGDGNLAGFFSLGWHVAIPTGAGLEISIDCLKIKGGGALFYDPKKEEVAGAIELDIASKASLKGIGIYQNAVNGNPRNWLAVATLDWPVNMPAFTLEGLGLLYGSNRTTSPEAFLAAISNGNLSALLFGGDVVANAPQFIAALDQLFPPMQDANVYGLLAEFGAIGGRITLALGLILDLQKSNIVRTYLIGRLVAVLTPLGQGQKPDPKAPVYILADGVGIWDSLNHNFTLRIALRNSRVWSGELTGGASIFRGSPQNDGANAGTYISVGGFHPAWTPPPGLFVPDRLKLTLSKGDHLKLEVKAYLAFTPSSFQVGIAGLLQANLYGLGIRGTLSIDVLFGYDAKFTVDLSFTIELLIASETVAGLGFTGQLAAYSPTILSGGVTVSFLFWSHTFHGCLKLQDGDDTPQPAPDVAAALAASVADARNWDQGSAPGLRLTQHAREGVWLSTNLPLRFRQAVAPLNVPIERFGAAQLPSPQTFRIDSISTDSGALSTAPLKDEFAPGMFLNLSQEQMLAGQGYEILESGAEISRARESGATASTTGEFEEIILDPKLRPQPPARPPISPEILGVLTMFVTSVHVAPKPVVLRHERYRVIDQDLNPQTAPLTLFEAHAASRAGWRIRPEAEVQTL
jgi:hypothetical protein